MTPERWRQIEELYHAARERAPADRSALLAEADAELRREVEAMLEQDASSKILDHPAKDILIDSRLTNVTPGSQLGPYQIETLIGSGGMAEVYRALDTRLNRPVAIKFLSPELVNESARSRFHQEARMASALNHPHILTVLEAGEFEGKQYLVTEFVDGGTIVE